MKKLFCFVLAVTLSLSIVSSYTFNETTVYAEDEDISEDTGNIAGYAAGSVKTINDIIDEYKFSYSQGHGFAAERGNNLADILKGEDASVVGDNNLKNGEDRIIKNTDGTITFIQDKYYKDVSQGINACFENGKFRYVDANENAMQIEVPSDQYEEAVEIMRGKIEAGNLENVGITDPDEAETLVRKGNLTYQQAKNLAKAGTIESLKYDATNGIISAGYAIGISAVINYAVCRLNGYSNKEALETAAIQGLKTGGVVFCYICYCCTIFKNEC